jgi:hypothetical protein
MKGAGVSGSSKVRADAANGALKPRKKNGAAAKPSGEAAAVEIPAADFLGAPLADESAAIDCPMWPIHPVVWLQPDGAPTAPGWSGLAIERRNRIPMPDFQPSEIAVFDIPVERNRPCDPLSPNVCATVPLSDLSPLGWDPRAACRKEGGK